MKLYFNSNELYSNPVTVWDRIGFLEGLSGKTKNICRINYQNMAVFLYEKDINTMVYGFDLSAVIFPIIRRVASSCPLVLKEPSKLWDFICEIIRDNIDHFKNVVAKSGGKIDLEAYASRRISEEIIDVLKSESCDTTTQ